MKLPRSRRLGLALFAATLASTAAANKVQAPAGSLGCQAPMVRDAQELQKRLRLVLAEPVPTVDGKDANLAVARRIVAMGDADQDIRRIAMRTVQRCKIAFGSAGMAGIMTAGREIGETTRTELASILDRSGWPKISGYGAQADRSAFLITLHADSDVKFQVKVLKVLHGLAAQGETDRANYAVLYDRVHVNSGQPQRYGTQGKCEGLKWVAAKIKDEAGLAKRRVSMGLPPMAAYTAQVEQKNCKA